MTIATAGSIGYCGQLTAQLSIGKTGQTAKATAANAGFSVAIEATVSVETVAPQSRTLEDVKREFYSYLDSLAIDPGLSRASLSVTVTDAAFEKMLANPEYERKMKDLCARDLCDPGWTKAAGMGIPASACVITIDPNREEEYLASSYSYPAARSKADGDSFWSRRTKNDKAAKKAQEKRNAEKQLLAESLQERAAARNVLLRGLFYGSTANIGAWHASGNNGVIQ